MKKDLVLLFLLILPTFAWLFQKGYFSMHDDLQSMRQYQMDKCFSDFQIPCRWVPDLGYGYGYPLFNYYPPLPYLIGQPFRWLGFQYLDIVKIVGILGFSLTAAFMYLLGKEFWGRGGGFISAAFYTYAPYHSVDFWVRGAMNEFWAMAFYPLIFWSTYKLIQAGSGKHIPVVSISISLLMLSHNPMLMIFAPVYLFWIVFWWIKFKSVSSIKYLFISAAWALGLAAFFTLPVIFETKHVSVWTLTSGYFNFLAHFLDLKQIFLRINWDYGSSVLGPNDTLSLSLGYLHWIIPAVLIISVPFSKKLRNYKYLILYLVFWILVSLFMSHSRSTPIWLFLKPLEFLQFPWRFLTLAVFLASFLSGAINLIFSKNNFIKKISPSLIIALLILLNGNYFRPREWYPDMTDVKKFSGKSRQLLVTSGIFDYLPKSAPAPPADARGSEINIISGQGIFTPLLLTSNRQEYLVTLGTPGSIELQTYYFPGWTYWLDGKEVKDYKLDPLLGRPQIQISPGRHEFIAVFASTPIRTLGNTLSLVSWGILLITLLVKTLTATKAGKTLKYKLRTLKVYQYPPTSQNRLKSL